MTHQNSPREARPENVAYLVKKRLMAFTKSMPYHGMLIGGSVAVAP